MKNIACSYLAVCLLTLAAAFGSAQDDSYTVLVDSKLQTATIRSRDAKSESSVLDGLCVRITYLRITRTVDSGLSLSLCIQLSNGFSEDIYIRSIDVDDISASAEITTLQHQAAQAFWQMALKTERKTFTFLAGRTRTGYKSGIRADSADWLPFKKTMIGPSSTEMDKLIHSPEIDGAVANATISMLLYFNRSGIDSLSAVKIEIPVKTTIAPPESVKETK